MPPINTADVELWWSHPNYTPPLARVRHKTAAITAASPGDIFRMDSSFPEIDDLTLGSLAGRMLGIKEHMGIGQVTKRRSFVNTQDVKEAAGGFTINIGDPGGPDEYFTAVIEDPGLNNDGRKRAGTVIAVFSKNVGVVVSAGGGTAAVNLAAGYAIGDTEMQIDAVAMEAIGVRTYFRIAGDNTNYQVVEGSFAIGGMGAIKFTPGLAAAAADDAVITLYDAQPNLDRYRQGNKWDYVIAELDFVPEVEGEVMGSFTLQAAGTGFEYVRP